MREHKIRALIKIVEESKIDELEISRWGKKIRICKTNINGSPPQAIAVTSPVAEIAPATPELAPPPDVAPSPSPQQAPETSESAELATDHLEITSPMVGTFYRRPAPEADPYVSTGDAISPGKILCIIEAMKLMNEIESEVSGTIVKIFVENAEPVEYNQPLFLVKLS